MAAHAGWVRVTHWIVAAGVLTLGVTGFVILMAHPRLYWGDAGNDLMPALLELPISRNYHHGGWDGVARTYDIFNQNGWGRSLHFLAAWCVVLTGAVYFCVGAVRGHFRENIWPSGADGRGYTRKQQYAYSTVLFVAAPLIALTGLTMAPAVTAAFPILLHIFGGYQSARTIHFFAFAALTLFVIGHVTLAVRHGVWRMK